jgi:hypothetical protein
MNKLKVTVAIAVAVALICVCAFIGGALGFWLSVIGMVLITVVFLLLAVLSSPKPELVKYRVYVRGNDKFICSDSAHPLFIKCIHKGKECLIGKSVLCNPEKTYMFYVFLPEIPYLSVEQSAKTEQNVSPTDAVYSHL